MIALKTGDGVTLVLEEQKAKEICKDLRLVDQEIGLPLELSRLLDQIERVLAQPRPEKDLPL